MAVSKFWRFIDTFTIDEAVALLCDIEPGTSHTPTPDEPNDQRATRKILEAAIFNGELKATYAFFESLMPGCVPKQWAFLGLPAAVPGPIFVERHGLKVWAPSKGMRPSFLQPQRNRGGRPPRWDWNGATQEVERIAKSAGLPPTMAELTRRIMQWFTDNQGEPPDERAVERFVSDKYGEFRARAPMPRRRAKPTR